MAVEMTFKEAREKAIANILAKVKDGKTLTNVERRALDDEERRQNGQRENRTAEQMAEEYGVTRMTIIRWQKQGAPFHDDKEFFLWLRKNRCRGANEWRKEFAAKNPDLIKSLSKGEKKPLREIKTAEELRDEYLEELQIAKDEEDEEREKITLNAYLKIDKQLREAALAAQKLGIESGEMIAREEVERIIKVMVYAGNACVKGAISQMAQKLAALDSPKEVEKVLAPAVLGGRIFEGFLKVSKAAGPSLVPAWLVNAMQSEGKQYLNGVNLS